MKSSVVRLRHFLRQMFIILDGGEVSVKQFTLYRRTLRDSRRQKAKKIATWATGPDAPERNPGVATPPRHCATTSISRRRRPTVTQALMDRHMKSDKLPSHRIPKQMVDNIPGPILLPAKFVLSGPTGSRRLGRARHAMDRGPSYWRTSSARNRPPSETSLGLLAKSSWIAKAKCTKST